MTRLSLQDKVTRTSTANGGSVDISAITGDWTIVIEVLAMNDANQIRLALEDSVDAFSAKLPGPAWSIYGQLTTANQKRFTIKKQDFPDLRFGTASAVLRLVLAAFGGSSKSITYQSWIEY